MVSARLRVAEPSLVFILLYGLVVGLTSPSLSFWDSISIAFSKNIVFLASAVSLLLVHGLAERMLMRSGCRAPAGKAPLAAGLTSSSATSLLPLMPLGCCTALAPLASILALLLSSAAVEEVVAGGSMLPWLGLLAAAVIEGFSAYRVMRTRGSRIWWSRR